MAGRLNRIASRMWLLAGLLTLITSATGLLVYDSAPDLHVDDLRLLMPPQPRAELEWMAVGAGRLPAILVISLVSAGAAGGVAIGLGRKFGRPINAVVRAAARVSAGDRSVRVDRGRTTGETAELIDGFNRMAGELDACDRERTVLTAGLAHELRMPLTVLKGRLHGLEDGVIDPSSGEAGRLLRQVEHLLRIVEDLSTLAQADAGKLMLDRRLVDPGELLRAAVVDLHLVAAQQGVGFEESYDPALVCGDPVRLTQIFTNILTHAVKHAPPDRDVRVELTTAGDWAVARILDQGPGFDPSNGDQRFDPVWRAGAQACLGAGMGLTLAAKLAEAHGGRITAENRLDRCGACLAVWLPLARNSRAAGDD